MQASDSYFIWPIMTPALSFIHSFCLSLVLPLTLHPSLSAVSHPPRPFPFPSISCFFLFLLSFSSVWPPPILCVFQPLHQICHLWVTKHITLFLSLFPTCPSLSVQISISTALFSHLCLSVLVMPLISAVSLNSHHALSFQFTHSFLRISSMVLHKYQKISFNLKFHPGTCFCFIRVHVFWRHAVPPPSS